MYVFFPLILLAVFAHTHVAGCNTEPYNTHCIDMATQFREQCFDLCDLLYDGGDTRIQCKSFCRDMISETRQSCLDMVREAICGDEATTIINYPNGFPCDEALVPFTINHAAGDDIYPMLMPYENEEDDSCFLRMTPDISHPTGPSVFINHFFDESNEKYSFATNIGYRIFRSDLYEDADGLVFLLHQDEDGVNACCGARGGYLGYINSIMPALAIELDMYDNAYPTNEWSLDNGLYNIHVIYVDADGSMMELDEVGPLPLRTSDDGKIIGRLWVDYLDEVLKVYLNSSGDGIKPPKPNVEVPFSLRDRFVGNEVFIGFTAGSWTEADNQDIMDWTMKEA